MSAPTLNELANYVSVLVDNADIPIAADYWDIESDLVELDVTTFTGADFYFADLLVNATSRYERGL
jgi:hypothetical protein